MSQRCFLNTSSSLVCSHGNMYYQREPSEQKKKKHTNQLLNPRASPILPQPGKNLLPSPALELNLCSDLLVIHPSRKHNDQKSSHHLYCKSSISTFSFPSPSPPQTSPHHSPPNPTLYSSFFLIIPLFLANSKIPPASTTGCKSPRVFIWISSPVRSFRITILSKSITASSPVSNFSVIGASTSHGYSSPVAEQFLKKIRA
mmetsp:Transcript_27631/g.69478  ORF Transcript_27631/g.69478 Transcript_27631/m.69478 type:complete len:201 (+) Transcript_27631:490-1092(+)